MTNGIKTGDPRGFNKGRSSKFCEGSRVPQTPKEGRITYRPKRPGNKNKNEDISPKTLNDKYYQASSRQLIYILVSFFAWLRINPHGLFNAKTSLSKDNSASI